MLPGMDGFDVCRQIRKESNVPILMLTARDDEIDRVVGLEVGADDYLTKPFSIRELVARVKALLRRMSLIQQEINEKFTPSSSAKVLEFGNLQILAERREVQLNKKVLELKPKEYELLFTWLNIRVKCFPAKRSSKMYGVGIILVTAEQWTFTFVGCGKRLKMIPPILSAWSQYAAPGIDLKVK